MTRIKQIIADSSNYTKCNNRKIDFIVIHYTGNDGDTAQGNCNYFQGANRKSSAHYFCDENEVCQSVLDKDRAWHCGATSYKHDKCRNSNSIGIELCSRKDSKGHYYFKDETIKNAVELTKEKIKQYNISLDNVLRHFDVTGKNCPAPFVDNKDAWLCFKNALKDGDNMQNFKTIDDVPTWAKATIKKLIDKKALAVNEQNEINVSYDFCRIMTVLDRLGILK